MANASKSGETEVKVRTFAHGEDVVIPQDETLVSVDNDRSMGVTRVVTSRPYDKERSDQERADRAGPAATPTYPQPAGAVPAPPVPPSTSFAWGSIDTTKVQNLEDLKKLPPPLAEQEAAGLKDPEDLEPGEPEQAAKDETEVATEKQSEANKESADKAETPNSGASSSEDK